MTLREIARQIGTLARAGGRSKILLASAAAALFLCAGAKAVEKPKTETVQFKSGDQTLSGFLALPDQSGKHPAMMVIHESWGLNDWVTEQTEKLAEQGYVTLAVDLYRGKTPADPAEAHELIHALTQDGTIKDLKAAFDYLATRPDVKPDNIGVIGWGTGGALGDATGGARCQGLESVRGELWSAANRSGRSAEYWRGGVGKFRGAGQGHHTGRCESISGIHDKTSEIREPEDLR